MTCTFNDARDTMLQVFKDAWDLLGFPAVYTDVESEIPTGQTVWARAIVRHADGGQASLSGPINGATRHEQIGTVIVQVFAPVGDGSTAAYDAAQAVASAFRKARVGVSFYRVRINEVGAKGAFTQLNVLCDFSYDQEETFP